MSDGSKVDMSLDDIIKMGGRGRGGRGRGAGRGGAGGRGRGRGRGAGVGRAANNQQRPGNKQQIGRGARRNQGRGFRRGGNLTGRGRGQNTKLSFNTRQQLSTRGGGVVKQRIGNVRGQGRGRGMLKLKTAIQAQLQSPGQRNRGRGRGGRVTRRDVSTDVSSADAQFKNFQVSISGLGSTQGVSDLPEGIQMDTSFSIKHTTGITLNSRFTPKSDPSTSSNNRLVTANGRAVKHF